MSIVHITHIHRGVCHSSLAAEREKIETFLFRRARCRNAKCSDVEQNRIA